MDLDAPSLKDEQDSDEINKLINYIELLMNSATNRNTINKDNCIFYINKLLTSIGIKIQNDALTKEETFVKGTKFVGYEASAISLLLWLYDLFKPDPTVRAAAQVTTRASHLINRTGSLINSAWEEEETSTMAKTMPEKGRSSIAKQGQSPMIKHA